ncbi:uroporphyrinogen-III synthase [Bradyrhizobium sp.]|uniref:uroporphyrinogen-III synthase n=1 Tax=Bradyrhizobium sp. TaxID=376 RepID=UPI002D5BD66B|nr:uroporphyrinogen-III synthase [Bradyrhizobium sp.]HZR74857.1 uroporphyrinogen-III synthase [Bradyrhizobium sp.]
MAILVTRPLPDGETTVGALRAKGFDALLAPMLRFEPIAFHDDRDVKYGAVIVTSANALRAIETSLQDSPLLKLPLFAVGERTAQAARAAGFANVISADSDASGLRDRILASVKAKALKKTNPLLYLAGADLARDLPGELGERGFTVVTQTTYRMVPVAHLPEETRNAFAADKLEAVLHYSRRSARAFIEAARAAGVEISALSLPQYCLSPGIATVLRDAGAAQVIVASSPDESALFGALESQ